MNTHYGAAHILKDVDIDIHAGEMVCLLGGNASGKTTTLKTMLGYLRPSSGVVYMDGENVNGWSTAQRVGHGLTMVPENRRLFKRMTVRENLEIGAYLRRERRSRRRLRACVRDVPPRQGASHPEGRDALRG